ncbi:MAG: fibrobacter succinogenes major paralogous domain-containing protein [Bacteroidales bacterium]|nr:fibrobacter succinogenes major paralogous domain-containing protein [Bacteroidales bacterium]
MKKRFIYSIILSSLIIVFITCEEENKAVPPTVDTASVDEIYNTSAKVGGRVTNDGGAEITERGIYWGISSSPEINGTKLQIGTGIGIFSETLSDLTPGVRYYIKAYASNNVGTSYGNETFFTTQINYPSVTTLEVSELTLNTAKIGGNVTDDGGYEVAQRGIYWGTDTLPQLTGNKVVLGSGLGEFSHTLTELSSSFIYYYVAYATNIKGTAYGDEISFSTDPVIPTVYTIPAVNITSNSAIIGGNVSSNGGITVTERGIYWGISTSPETTGTKLIIGSGTGEFSDTLINLDPGTDYYLKAFATNSIGTAYGDEKNYTTLGEEPLVTILEYTDLEAYNITLKGLVSANDLSTTVEFEYGTTTAYGSSIAAINSPVTENDDTVSATILGLTPETLYHYRIKAENELGIVYSEDSTFTTVITGIAGTVTDIDGNVYQTIGIGYQEWMTENLKTKRYNDTDSITLVINDSIWSELITEGYCWYNNDETSYKNVYGGLYNWHVVNTGKLCPSGWHVPTNEDISELFDYLGGANEAGGLLKESGTVHWKSPNTGATNEYDFNALPGGKRFDDGTFDFMTVEGNWWSSYDYSTHNASYFYLLYNYSNSLQSYINKKYGMSIRCIKD